MSDDTKARALPWQNYTKWGACWGGVALFLFFLKRFASQTGSRFFDFQSYYMAAKAFRAGADPYQVPHVFPFVYPPLTLYGFEVFTWLPLHRADLCWLGLKIVALAALGLLLHREFVDLKNPMWLLFLLYGYNAAILHDLETGNISLIEQLLLWAAFSLLLKKKPLSFGILIALASQCKLFLFFFSFLLLVVEEKPRWREFLVSVLILLLLTSLNFLVLPGWLTSFQTNLQKIDYEGRFYNPSLLAFSRDLSACLLPYQDVFSSRIGFALYLVLALFILIVSGWALYRHRRFSAQPDRLLYIMFFCVLYGLIVPRFKIYSYILILPPMIYIYRRTTGALRYVAIILSILPASSFYFPSLLVVNSMNAFYRHLPLPECITLYPCLFSLMLVWWMYRSELKRPHAPVMAQTGQSNRSASGDR